MTGINPVEWKQRTKSHWDRAAEPWDRWYDWYARALRPLVEWSCNAAGVTTGARVLDVACGTGEPALTAAQRAGSSGLVLATDIAPAMVTVAERRANQLAITNMRFAAMDAEALDVPPHSFDCCTFACGLMFCPVPSQAVVSIRRALRPGGRYAISVWDHPELNAFATVFGAAVAEIFGGAMPEAGAPGPFRLANRNDLVAVLREGGLTSIDIESLPMQFPYESVEEYIAITTDFACGLKPKFDAASAADLERFNVSLRKLIEPYVLGDGSVRLPATPLCASGSIA